MKKYLFLITIITLGLFVQSSFSQDLNSLKNAPFIFKGRELAEIPFKTENGIWMIAYPIEINSIYKGDGLKLDTIILIAESPKQFVFTESENCVLNLDATLTPEEEKKFRLGYGCTYLFFCNPYKSNLKNLPPKIQLWNRIIQTKNSIILEPICNTRNCLFYYYNGVRRIDNSNRTEGFLKIKGFEKEFNSEEELMDYLKKESIISQNENNKKKDVEKIKSETNNVNSPKINYAQRLKNYNNYMQHLQIRMQNASQNNKSNSCKEFFISEYIDGPNKNKVLEIYNPTDSIKSLNGYSIKIFQNGAPTPLEIQLQGNVNPKETYVISHPNADPDILAKANQTDVKMNFDGNDAVVLNQGQSNYIDKIGEIGVNPGNGGWNVPPNGSTKAHDLRRKFPIDKGETDWNQGKNQWNVFPQDSLLNIKQHQNVCATLLTNDISFSFANPTETGTSPKYFEFDIMVSGNNNSTYLDNAAFAIQYNTTAFGDSIVANNTITITKGTNFTDPSYTDPDTTVIDDAFNIFRFAFYADYNLTSWNRTLITTSQQQLLHIKIEIQDCSGSTDLSFTDQSNTAMVTAYFFSQSVDPMSGFNPYDNVNYGMDLNHTLCPPPVITGMSTNTITSGTNSVLTIQGSNFGNTRGTSQIWMCNDENCSYTIFDFDYIDYLLWSDTEIKFIVPSRVDTLPSIFKGKGVGSGNVFVWRSDGVTTVPNSVSHLEVSYANKTFPYHTYTSAYKKVPMRVIPDYGDTTKYFYLDTSITNSPERELSVRTALRRWSCNTKINWAIKGITTAQHLEDDISVIYMDDNFHGTPLGSTYFPSTMYLCKDDSGDTIGYFKDIDIGFSRDFNNVAKTWLYDTSYTLNLLPNQHDFFAVAQHELGHAHGLDHVNDTTDILFYADKSSPINNIPYYNRLDIYSSPDAVNGGNYIFQKSQQIHSCGFITQMIPSSTSNCSSGISELFNNDVHLFAYPNPLNDVLYVTYNLNHSVILYFTMYDYIGNKIKEINLGKQNIGSHNIKINVSDISSGLYFLSVKINNRVETIKLIKQ